MEFKPVIKHFNNKPIEFLIDKEGEIWVFAEQLGKALKYYDKNRGILRIYNRHKERLKNQTGVVTMTTPGGQQKKLIFKEQAAYFIIMRNTTDVAFEFQWWFSGTINDLRKDNFAQEESLNSLKKRLHEYKEVVDVLLNKKNATEYMMPIYRAKSHQIKIDKALQIQLIIEFYERKDWKILGYKQFGKFCEKELGISQKKSYEIVRFKKFLGIDFMIIGTIAGLQRHDFLLITKLPGVKIDNQNSVPKLTYQDKEFIVTNKKGIQNFLKHHTKELSK